MTSQQIPPTSYSSTAAPLTVAAGTGRTSAATTPTVAVVRRSPHVKRTLIRLCLWVNFFIPIVVLGSYFARPVPHPPLVAKNEIVSQNGQMVARRVLGPDGMARLAVGHVGQKPLWTEVIPGDAAVALSPDGRYLITSMVVRQPGVNDDPAEFVKYNSSPDYNIPSDSKFECRETTNRASIWKRLSVDDPLTTPVGSDAIAVSPDGTQVAVAVVEGVRFYSLQSGEFIRFLRTAPHNLGSETQLSFSPDGRTLYAPQASGTDYWEMNTVR